MTSLPKWAWAVLFVGFATTVVTIARWRSGAPDGMVVFEGVRGPAERSAVRMHAAARWEDDGAGDPSRLAILLTDPDSAWLGLVHGLRTIGVPFRITTDYHEALTHRVVLVYPTISGRKLDPEGLRALARFPETGGTLIGTSVEGGGLDEIFGFKGIASSRTRRELTFAASPLTAAFTDPREHVIRFSNPQSGTDAMGSIGYLGVASPLATFDDGTAAITARRIGKGRAYALGIDPGFLLLTGYNNREQGVARAYVNEYEPALDVVLRLLLEMYREGNPDAVTVQTVPEGRELSVLLTHDVDFTRSLPNARIYAEWEASAGLHATYFIQTKYMRDWNDSPFFTEAGVATVRRLQSLGMEVGSHSVAHSLLFNRLPLGSGDEQYPDYRPFVRDANHTEGASVLGEMRVSKFLIEHALAGAHVESFRPGHLRNPYEAPQALEATGYRFSSSATANNSLTHLPFRLTASREGQAETGIFEFPVTVEDEASPSLLQRLPQSLALSERLASYGGLLVALIHTDVVEAKLEYEQRLVEALRARAWFGTVREFGEFWSARDQVRVDVRADGARLQVVVHAPASIAGLTLALPVGYRAVSIDHGVTFTQSGGRLILGSLSGTATVVLEPADSDRPY